jgi:bifunctional non-homologous end joining protein LigD
MFLHTSFIEPCLPTPAERPPGEPGWLHEIKHDGYRLMARRNGAGVRLFTRNGHDWPRRFPLIAQLRCAYVVEFRTAKGEALAISIPRSEATVIPGAHALRASCRRCRPELAALSVLGVFARARRPV